jgi:hypothetical protein
MRGHKLRLRRAGLRVALLLMVGITVGVLAGYQGEVSVADLPGWAVPASPDKVAQRWQAAFREPLSTGEREWVSARNRFLVSLFRQPDEDKYVYGLANTLQLLVDLYVRSEGRIPSLAEFLGSPYNLLSESAFVNPYTGKRIVWSDEPIRGALWFRDPGEGPGYLTILPWIPSFPESESFLGKLPGQNGLGVPRLYPQTLNRLTANYARSIAENCAASPEREINECTLRTRHTVKRGYSREEWRTLMATRVLREIFLRVGEQFEEGLPASLEDLRSRYWWVYNTNFINPFTGSALSESSFLEPVPGTFVYAVSVPGTGRRPIPYLIPVGSGRFLYPYDHPDPVITVSMLGDYDYVRGLEGKRLCEVWREWIPDGDKDRAYSLMCPQHDKVFLTSPPQ